MRPLRILMLAPEPFFEPRGTPFSEYHRIKALTELGHPVDLVTYPFGTRRAAAEPAHRANGPAAICDPGPDRPFGHEARARRLSGRHGLAAVAARDATTSSILTKRPAFSACWLARSLGVPHLYDMHSSLPQQLTNFRFAKSRVLRWVFQKVEDASVHGSDVVVTICQDLQDHVEAMGAGERSVLIENVMGGDVEEPPSVSAADVRARSGASTRRRRSCSTPARSSRTRGSTCCSTRWRSSRRTRPDARLLVVGGRPEQVEAARAHAAKSGAAAVFTGHQPAREIPAFVEAADILASPRIAGTNTPLKIYSYLRAGKPIVATDLLTHTQVLDRSTALLVRPEPEAFAAALEGLIERSGSCGLRSHAQPPSARGRATAERCTSRGRDWSAIA